MKQANSLLPLLITAALAAAGGWFAARKFPGAHDAEHVQKNTAAQSPMHPWVKSDKAGDCTICGMSLAPAGGGENHADSAANGIVMLPPGSPNILGVEVSEVKRRPLARTLRVAGMIGEDESRHGVISAPVEGRIISLAMNHDGQPITLRQPIATIFSRTLLAAADEYKLAFADGSGPALDQARRKLEQGGLVAEQILAIPQRQPDDANFSIVSPLDGTVVKSFVSEGRHLREGDRMFETANFSRMWCMFIVYERDLPLVHERQIVTVRPASLPGEEIRARVTFVSPNLDEATRSAHVRVVLENPGGRLKNRTYAEGTIELDAAEALTIPRSAVEALAIASFTRIGTSNLISLQFKATVGTTYNLQYSPDMTTSSWVTVGSVTSDGTAATFTETDATRLGQARGYYRVSIPVIP